jgi:hypothetical protein
MILSTHLTITSDDASRFFSSRIPLDIIPILESYIIADEIKEALFFIPNDKTLSP